MKKYIVNYKGKQIEIRETTKHRAIKRFELMFDEKITEKEVTEK